MKREELWLKMMEKQKVLDEVILREKDLQAGDVWRERWIAAFVEFGEYFEADIKLDFSDTQEEYEKNFTNMKEELADVVHFLLALSYTYFENTEQFKKVYSETKLPDASLLEMTWAFIYATKACNSLKRKWKYWTMKEAEYREVEKNLVLALKCIEAYASLESLYEEYEKKNKINFERIESGTY